MNKNKALVTLLLVAAGTVLGLSLTVANAAVDPRGVNNVAYQSQILAPRSVTFASNTRVTTDAGSATAQPLRDYGILDLQYLVQGSDGTNAWLLKLQHSNDGTNWVDGATIASGIAATAGVSDMTRTHNYGGFTRVFFDTTNSVAFTVTVNAIAR
jgi:hypothetical protein